MPHPHMLGGPDLGSAVITPPVGREGSVSALETGFREGTARDPSGPRTIVDLAPNETVTVPVQDPPATAPIGTPGRRRHPVPLLAWVRRWGMGEWDQENRGQHGELVPVASTPRGEMTRFSNVRGNTFRLPPAPWDSAQFVGIRQVRPAEET